MRRGDLYVNLCFMATALTVTWSLGQVELRVREAIWYRYRRRVGPHTFGDLTNGAPSGAYPGPKWSTMSSAQFRKQLFLFLIADCSTT